MVTPVYEWNILEWNVKQQTNLSSSVPGEELPPVPFFILSRLFWLAREYPLFIDILFICEMKKIHFDE